MIKTIKNSHICLKVNSFGAEMCSFERREDHTEMLWCGDEKWWKRQAPILFPFVGSLWNGTYRHKGKEYKMGQHGFARDMEFDLLSETDKSLEFILRSNDETRAKYPFDFELIAKFRLENDQVTITYTVRNTGNEDMYFQIGSHPAFVLQKTDKEDPKGYLRIVGNEVILSLLGEKGCLSDKKEEMSFMYDVPIEKELFESRDTLILEEHNHCIAYLLDNSGWMHLEVMNDAPVFGVWSPVKNGEIAPFICLEPWCGRCDRENFTGELKDKDWINCLAPGKEFKTWYNIRIIYRQI